MFPGRIDEEAGRPAGRPTAALRGDPGLSLSGQRDSFGDVLEAESTGLALRANMRSERPRDLLEPGHDFLRLGGLGKSKYKKRKK